MGPAGLRALSDDVFSLSADVEQAERLQRLLPQRRCPRSRTARAREKRENHR